MFRTVTTEELLGSLNEFEQVKLPQQLYFAGRLVLARNSPASPSSVPVRLPPLAWSSPPSWPSTS